MSEHKHFSRRQLLGTSGAMFAWAYAPKFVHAAQGRDPRLIVIILRGGLDGLSAVAPIGDPLYAALRGDIALRSDGATPALALDSFFALHPSMPTFGRLYRQGAATVVHAVATPYRERSHFDGQDVLESGFAGPGVTRSGWLNRVLAALPKGEKIRKGGLGVGPSTPLILRGDAPVTGWAPTNLQPASEDLALRVLDLYAQRDPALGAALKQGLDIEKLASREMTGDKAKAIGGNPVEAMRNIARGAAKLIAAEDGPRIAALAFDGWDTHANEGGATGRLAQLLGGLDGAFAEMETELAKVWKDTSVVVVTEFGRTARINGTIGTDHGTGTLALLAGGAVKGGRVIADWPGLAEHQLFEKRDLKPTTDLRAVLKGILADQFGLSDAVLGNDIFPESLSVKPMRGLTA